MLWTHWAASIAHTVSSRFSEAILPQNKQQKHGGGGFRGGSAVKALALFQRLEFESQHPHLTAYNYQ